MDWKDLAGVVSKAAPVLGGILGGPAGVAVGGLVATALGTDASPDSVSAAILRDPQAAIKLKELETNSRVQLQQLAVTAEQNRLQAADRDSARRLAARQPRDWVRPAVTVLLLLGAAGIVFFVFSGMAEGLLRDATASLTVGTVIGYWFNELKQVLAFWFGTTGETQRANAEVRQFAVSPGSVTFPDDAGGR
ncbi:hypothetical protein SB816_28515 [Achromobacter sp. SIMBA_011]|uniref:hypothetical protein n=1 Tax=Achromobacter sp. SIMBA_011 TaxID=3085759 RepID=UPI0039795ABE